MFNTIENRADCFKIKAKSLNKQAIFIMGDTIEDMDVEIEQKDKTELSESKIGLLDCKVTEEMKKQD